MPNKTELFDLDKFRTSVTEGLQKIAAGIESKFKSLYAYAMSEKKIDYSEIEKIAKEVVIKNYNKTADALSEADIKEITKRTLSEAKKMAEELKTFGVYILNYDSGKAKKKKAKANLQPIRTLEDKEIFNKFARTKGAMNAKYWALKLWNTPMDIGQIRNCFAENNFAVSNSAITNWLQELGVDTSITVSARKKARKIPIKTITAKKKATKKPAKIAAKKKGKAKRKRRPSMSDADWKKTSPIIKKKSSGNYKTLRNLIQVVYVKRKLGIPIVTNYLNSYGIDVSIAQVTKQMDAMKFKRRGAVEAMLLAQKQKKNS